MYKIPTILSFTSLCLLFSDQLISKSLWIYLKLLCDFHILHNAPCLPPQNFKLLHNPCECLFFLLGWLSYTEEIKNKGYAKLWGANKVQYITKYGSWQIVNGRIHHFRYIKIHPWLRGLGGIKQNKYVIHYWASRWFLLFYSPKADAAKCEFYYIWICLLAIELRDFYTHVG